MKILVACDDYCYKSGGDYYLRDFGMTLALRYLMAFDEVRMVLRTKEINDISQLGKYNIKVKDPRIEIYPISFFQGPKQYAREYFNIKREMSKITDGCDFAIFRLPSTTAFAVWKQALKHKLPYGVELVYDCYDGYRQASGVNKLLWRQMHAMQIKACEHAIGIAPVTAKYLQQHYTPKTHDIIQSHYSSVEMGREFYTVARKYPDKRILTLVHVALQVEFNGRKGHNDILKSLKLLKDEGIMVNVVFVGEDYNGGIQKLKEMAADLGVSDQIRFTGFLKYADMRETLISSDIAILPTKAEGLPRVLIEAMAVGLPCIASNVSGNPELIDREFLFDYGDVTAIADQIKRLVIDKDKYEAMSRTNFNRSLEYSKEVLDPRRKDFYTLLRRKVETLGK